MIGSVYNIGWTLHTLGVVDYLTIELFNVVDVVDPEQDQVISTVNKVKTIADHVISTDITVTWTVDSGLSSNGGYFVRITGHAGNSSFIGVGGEFYIATSQVPLKFTKVKRDSKKTQEMIAMHD